MMRLARSVSMALILATAICNAEVKVGPPKISMSPFSLIPTVAKVFGPNAADLPVSFQPSLGASYYQVELTRNRDCTGAVVSYRPSTPSSLTSIHITSGLGNYFLCISAISMDGQKISASNSPMAVNLALPPVPLLTLQPQPTPMPLLMPLTPKPVPPPPARKFELGDVTANGMITSADAALVQRAFLGLVELTADQKSRADVDGDGKITNADAKLISYKGLGLIEIPAKFGDVSGDMRLDNDDAKMVMDYVDGKIQLTDQQKLLADINGDGIVNAVDAQVIGEAVEGTLQIPLVLGDLDGDGKAGTAADLVILSDYLNRKTKNMSIQQLANADADADGRITFADLHLIRLRGKGLVSLPAVLGDVSESRTLGGVDLAKIKRNTLGLETFTEQQKALGDVNCDGKITDEDYLILQSYLSGNLSELPVQSCQ